MTRIMTVTVRPVKPTRKGPRPAAPFGQGIIEPRPEPDPCTCGPIFHCVWCLDREHAARKEAVLLAPRFIPSVDDSRWAAETSPTRDEHYTVTGPADSAFDEWAAE